VWTLLSIALRVAQAISLHLKRPPFPVGPFIQEMRRRTWFAIGLMDAQASLDRGSEPMIPHKWVQYDLPANINDADFGYNQEGPLRESDSFTDMTYTLIICKAQCVMRSMDFSVGTPGSGGDNWNARQELANSFRERASLLLQGHDTSVFHWYTRQAADYIGAIIQLIAIRPFRKQPNSTPAPVKGSGVLKLSVEILQMAQQFVADQRGLPWRWLQGIFPPWHALAVAIAEICVCEEVKLLEESWPTIELIFERLNSHSEDSRQGTLWFPMEKLMIKAREKMRKMPSRTSHPHVQNHFNQASKLSKNIQPSHLTSGSHVNEDNDMEIESLGTTGIVTPSGTSDAWLGLSESMYLGDGIPGDASDAAAWASWEGFVADLPFNDEFALFPGGIPK
jgi:Fungal specific transcription factor domain